jgi:hypothetical protein
MRALKALDREQVLFAVAATAVPILLCGFMFGFDIALNSAAFWALPKGDMAAMTAAWEAFARQPWHWPLTTVTGLHDKPVSIVFTDSLPWLAIALKATGLARWFNPMGLFLLLSYPLQVWSMIGLLRALGTRDRWVLLLGGLLSLVVPAWIERQFGHIALSGHWILILALILAVRSIREGLTWQRALGFAGLALFAVGIHAYHLVPIAACLGAAGLSEVTQRRPNGFWNAAIAGGLSGWAVWVGMKLLNYDDGLGATGGAAALGFYSMNLVGPLWPQASWLAGQGWTGEWFTGVVDATGGQAFEGFNYLGAGVLLLILAMVVGEAIGAIRQRGVTSGFWARWTPMVLAMLGLTLWAVGWSAYAFKTHLYDLPKPSGDLAETIGGFRAHGRFFWAVGYLLLALAVTWTAKLPRKVGLSVLVAALALQAVDTSNLRHAVRQVFAEPDWPAYPLVLTGSRVTAGRPWVFAPAYFCSPSQRDIRVIKQMNLAIVRNGGTTNTFATARNNDPACDQVRPEVAVDAAPGDRRIVVVMRNEQPRGGFLAPIAGRSDCYWFGRGVACGRDLGGLKGLRALKPGEVAGP